MKTIIFVLLIGTSLAVPIEKPEEWKRVNKSPSFRSPVPGALKTPIGLFEAASAPQPQYLELDHKTDDHKRSYYEPVGLIPAPHIAPHPVPSYPSTAVGGLVPAAHALAIPQAPPPAVGLFPNARVGGCNIPILLSCSPNVVAGYLSQSHGYTAPAYRDDGDFMREADWVENMRAANHHKVSEDYPDPLKGSHHTVSKDYPEPNLTRIVKTPPSGHYQHVEANHADRH